MGNFIPVEPEKWAEMVKALALVDEMDKTINASQAECRRLKAEVERLTFDPLTYLDDQGEWMPRHIHIAAVERLKGEVERLRKAGDDLVLSVEWRNVVVSIPPTMSLIESASFLEVSEKCRCNLHNFDDVIKAWKAAKEVQS